MRILVTRPRDDAEPFAARLRARGHDVVIEPLIEIRPVADAAIDLSGVQALLLTSANGARAFAAASARRDLGVLAVGDATAAAARDAGFAAVESAGGDVEDLARLAIARLDPAGGPLFHAAGSAIAGDLSGRLEAAGFTVRRAVLYRAEPASALSPAAREALANRTIDMVVLFSPRTAKTFASLVADAGLADRCAGAVAVGLSRAVIDAVAAAPWRAREAAVEPNEAALLAVIDRVAPARVAVADTATRRNVVIGAAVVGVAVMALVLATWLRPRGDANDAVSAQLAAAERQIATLGASVTAQADLARAIGAIDQRLAGMQARIGEIDARLAAVPSPAPDRAGELAELRGQIDAAAANRDDPQVAALVAETRRLAGELARVQETVAGVAARLVERAAAPPVDVAPALAALRQAVIGGGPFAAELLALQAVAGNDPATRATLAGLVPFAERGIPSFDRLRTRFARVAADVVRARPREADAPWWKPATNWAESLVTIRPIGDVPGDSPAAAVARAEKLLAGGDLEAADAALASLAGPAAAAAAPWRRDAQARLAAERLVGKLEPMLHGGGAAR